MIDQNYQYQDRINDSGSGFGAKHPDKKRKLKAGQKIQVDMDGQEQQYFPKI